MIDVWYGANNVRLFCKLKYFLADDGEVGGVGGAVVLKQDDTGEHHIYEHQSGAAESGSGVLALEYMEIF